METKLNPAEHRETVGVSLEQIADSTKISMRFLRAIEAGEYEKLPGGIYGSSYVRQYAEAIDFDTSALMADYLGVLNPEPCPEPPQRSSAGLFYRWFRFAS